MKTFSLFVVMLSMTLSSFAATPEHIQPVKGKVEQLANHWKATLKTGPSAKDCTVTLTSNVWVGSVQCQIQVSATAADCVSATHSALEQIDEARQAIQQALQ